MDAGETVDAGSSHQVHQEGLDSIVTMVGHTDGLGADILSQLLEILVTELARRHLYAYLMDGRVFCCFKVN